MRKRMKKAEHFNLEANMLRYAGLSADGLFDELGTSASGLSPEAVEERVEQYGENVITYGNHTPWFVRFLLSFLNPFNGVLLLVAVVSFVTDILFAQDFSSYATIAIILILIVISSVLKFVQEARSDDAAQKLKAMVSTKATVVRDGVQQDVEMSEIVPGDLIVLSSGDMLPADVRILTAKDLFVGQAALTGESEPVEKYARLKNPPMTMIEASNLCFMGSDIISGSALGVALSTGNSTYIGTIAKDLSGGSAKTSFDMGIASVSKLLLRLMVTMVPIIFVASGFTKHDWMGAFLFALSVAVGLTPALLPMIMTTTLARGALAMSKHKTIIKNLSAIQSFGAMDVLCTDKTGTLTEDKIVLEKYLDIHGNEDMRVLRHAYLNSYFQTGLKNLMDIAIINHAEKDNLGYLKEEFVKVDEIPFDFARRRMSVVLENKSGDKRQLITKGAVEEMLSICSLAEYQGDIIPLTEEIRTEVLERVDRLNAQGLRVLGVAQKNEVHGIEVFNASDEADMVLMGFVGFLDPPKESSKEAIAALYQHGVRVVVLTGDNEKVALQVCRQVGMEVGGVLLGQDVEEMDDQTLAEKAEQVNLFAKLSPSQKKRVVGILQKNGHTVGYMGDGINDSPAMRQADVGISVDSAVDIAKETADIILLEKSLMVLEQGVVEGRRTFGNIVKYIKMASSGNFGNMFSMLAASIFLPFLPMLPTQILTQNLLYDFSQIAIPLDTMDPEYIRKPHKWDADGIAKFMYWMGPVSSLFDIITFVVLYFVMGFNTPASAASFHTGWFLQGLLSQTMIVHLIRTSKIPFIQSRAAKPLLLTTGIICAIGLIIPYTWVGQALEMQPLPLTYFPWLIGILACYCLTVQLIKKLYIKKYGHWL